MRNHSFSASQKAQTLHAEPISDHAHQSDVPRLSPQIRLLMSKPVACMSWRIQTIVMLYGTLSIKTERIDDQTVNIKRRTESFHWVASSIVSASVSVTHVNLSDHTTIKSHEKKKIIFRSM